ncbi:MAG: hypothetical protein D6679_09215, partial [Candidatus Hydrogenedentota bacterium]
MGLLVVDRKRRFSNLPKEESEKKTRRWNRRHPACTNGAQVLQPAGRRERIGRDPWDRGQFACTKKAKYKEVSKNAARKKFHESARIRLYAGEREEKIPRGKIG